MSKNYETRYKEQMRKMGLSEAEVDLAWEYVDKHCDSNKSAAAFYKKHWMEQEGLSEEEVDEMFGLAPKEKTVPKSILAHKHSKKVAKSNDLRADRMEYLKEALKEKSLWGTPVEETNNTLKYLDPKTNTHFSVKLARHKLQQITTRPMPEKPNRKQQRSIELHEVVLANPELFEKVDTANNAVSFIEPDNPTYSFGSLRITHHKS